MLPRGRFALGPPATLRQHRGCPRAAHIWCRDCRHQVEPDPAALAERYGTDLSVPDWHKRLVCGQCGSRKMDFVVTGTQP
jgi:hypothetical protein